MSEAGAVSIGQKGEAKLLFDALEPQPPDALLHLIKLAARDQRADKIDLGVGVYRDLEGGTPILRAVKAAERILFETQETKAYLGPEGDLGFVSHIKRLLLGATLAADARIVGVQTPGGCGALRLGAELVMAANPNARIIVGRPTWANHEPLIGATGARMIDYPYYDAKTARRDFDALRGALADAGPGDVLLLHGSCHNPTGADLTPEMWAEVAKAVAARGLIPFVDIAYQGLGRGLEEDAAGTRLVVEAAEQALVAQSCDKNFGLYRERCGSLFVKASSPAAAEIAFGNLLGLGRRMWSMPPDHGAAIVRTIFDTPALENDWREELVAMCARIRSLRAKLAATDPRLAYIDDQNGMFSILPLGKAAVAELAERHGIYMAGSGRINIAGFSGHEIARFGDIIRPYLPERGLG